MRDKIIVGWQEWCILPQLKILAINVKVDTGARTSALHAFEIHPFYQDRKKHVQFSIHPLQYNEKLQVTCRARVVDERFVVSSNGHREHRYVITTPLTLAGHTWDIELTLSNRDPMKFRMLLGREALGSCVIVDPSKMHCQDTLGGAKPLKLYKA